MVEQVGAADIVRSSDVAVSPDGTTLLFTSPTESSPYHRRIMGLDLSREEVTPYVVVDEGILHDPAWLPTPGAFLFVRGTQQGHAWRASIARHDPGAPPETFTVLTAAMAAEYVQWLHVAPDGVRLLLGTNDHVALGRVDSEYVTPLARGTHPTWSPDAKRIAYLTFEQESDMSTIFVREDDGRTWPLARATGVGLTCPAFSPDGASIAYLWETTDQYEIWLTPASPGGVGKPLVRGTQALGCPAWAPDGTLYVVASWVDAESGKRLLRVRFARGRTD
jgi:Tol biopolymer transport system component